ncbi:MAG: hypothetical protein GY807_23205 [Gammaproteobacteria bacterium]|nr:hypothetical protein [Gammaproteobacteria bacterium]
MDSSQPSIVFDKSQQGGGVISSRSGPSLGRYAIRWIVGLALIFLMVLVIVLFYQGELSFLSGPASSINDELKAYLLTKQKQKIENPKRYDKPKEAQVYYVQKRAPFGQSSLPVERYGAASQHMRQMKRYSSATRSNRAFSAREFEMQAPAPQEPFSGAWQALGPGNVGGRTRALLIDPGNADIIYAAGVAGGVWKTTNGGTSWTALSDLIANLAVNSMAMSPQNPNVIYAGTGEGYFNGDFVRGDGIFKTTDGGVTWSQLLSPENKSDFHYVNDLVVSHNNAQVVYAATRAGVFRSIDGGAVWTQVQPSAVNGGCLDLAIRTEQDPDHVFAACGTFTQAAVFRTTDGGDSWASVLTEASMGRTSLAIAPSNEDIIYALSASVAFGQFEDGLHAVFRSTDGGGTWTPQVRNSNGDKLNTVLLTNPFFAFASECSFSVDSFFNQGWFDNVIAVDPLDPDVVWAGGIDLFRSDDGGMNWGLASYWSNSTEPQYVHADQHVIAFHPDYNGAGNKQMFVGNDGGVFRTDDALAATATGLQAPCDPSNASAQAWTSLNNGYGVTQFYHGAVYPDGLTYFGGTQDNGTIRGSQVAGVNAWSEIHGGDGGFVAVDPNNTQILFAELGGGLIQKSTDGGSVFAPASIGITESTNNFLFIAPFEMDPGNSNILWTGGAFMWRTTNQAESWEQASPFLPGVKSLSSVAISPQNSDVVIAGTSDGYTASTRSALSANSATVWTESPAAANHFISSLAFDPQDDQIVYATVSSFGTDHILKSVDTGSTWTPIDRRGQTDGIPDIPVHSIVIDPSDTRRLYVGTDLGVFVSTDDGQTWMVENSGFANVVTEKLVLNTHKGVNTLYAFTHGRGVFRVGLSPPAPSSNNGGSGNGGGGGCMLSPDGKFDALFLILVLLASFHALCQHYDLVQKRCDT